MMRRANNPPHRIEMIYQVEQTTIGNQVRWIVVEYDLDNGKRSILSIHRAKTEAEDEKKLAEQGKHSTQIQPGGSLPN